MQIKKRPCGEPKTNCYIATVDDKDFIIDPGINAVDFVINNIKKPQAILLTHGHFDHIYSVSKLQKKLGIPVYFPKNDIVLLGKNDFNIDVEEFEINRLIDGDEEIEISGIKILYNLYSGHTPGCSTITINDNIFTGDFIFNHGIGRSDFKFSNKNDMKNSLIKFVNNIDEDKVIYPGHGFSTTIYREKEYLKECIKIL